MNVLKGIVTTTVCSAVIAGATAVATRQKPAPKKQLNILLSGGFGGLGLITIERLLERGHKIAVIDITEKGEELAEKLGVAYRHADITDYEAVAVAAYQLSMELEGKFDRVLGMHGVAEEATIARGNPEVFKKALLVNTLGMKNLIWAVDDLLADDFYIAPLTSTAADVRFPLLGAYCISKLGVNGIVGTARNEFRGRRGIIGHITLAQVAGVPMTAGFDSVAAQMILNGRPGLKLLNQHAPLEPAIDMLVDILENPRMAAFYPIKALPAHLFAKILQEVSGPWIGNTLEAQKFALNQYPATEAVAAYTAKALAMSHGGGD
jgi:NAD(P)-dependent dehydrogenase (short-subunit alcohol dehydrogenase family)